MMKRICLLVTIITLAVLPGAYAETIGDPNTTVVGKLTTGGDITSGRFLFVNSNSIFTGSIISDAQLKVRDANLVLTNSGTGDVFSLRPDGMLVQSDTAIFRNDRQGGSWKFMVNQSAPMDTMVLELKNNGDTSVKVLEITGGSDLSEQFNITPVANGEVLPGMVVSIDPNAPGSLKVCAEAHDKKVAGIISGAGGLKAGMRMGQTGSIASGSHPVALTGRVYCYADQSNGMITPGDLLTTSSIPGRAMKVKDYTKALGSVIGKAMTPVNEDGLVLVLVGLK